MPDKPVFRFAPSPNGRLHLGHAYSALLSQRAAEVAGGVFLLRIEDIDTTRCKPEFDNGILADLHWLGLRWPEPVWRQSQRLAHYASAAKTLTHLLYPCFCTRSEIARRASGSDPDGAPLYPGTCRSRHPGEVAERFAGGAAAQWRLRMDAASAAAGALDVREMRFAAHELLLDEVRVRPADPSRWGDAVLLRKDTPTSYHLSVVVDDAAQGVTHLTRGTDLFAATDLHVLLQRLLGLPSPIYAHHELIRDESAEKLSKSKGSRSLASLREAGWTPGDVRRALGLG